MLIFMPPMVDLFPKDRPRQFLMAVFIAIIEFTRASLLWGVVDIIFAVSFTPRVKIWVQNQWYRFSRK